MLISAIDVPQTQKIARDQVPAAFLGQQINPSRTETAQGTLWYSFHSPQIPIKNLWDVPEKAQSTRADELRCAAKQPPPPPRFPVHGPTNDGDEGEPAQY